MENRGRFLSWNDKKKLTKILKFFQVNTRQWNGWFIIKQLSVIYAICTEYTTKLKQNGIPRAILLKSIGAEQNLWNLHFRCPRGRSSQKLFSACGDAKKENWGTTKLFLSMCPKPFSCAKNKRIFFFQRMSRGPLLVRAAFNTWSRTRKLDDRVSLLELLNS